MNRLAESLLKPESVSAEEYEKVIYESIRAVNRDNRTHINSDNIGYKKYQNDCLESPEKICFTN